MQWRVHKAQKILNQEHYNHNIPSYMFKEHKVNSKYLI